jgi:hypothetical protein
VRRPSFQFYPADWRNNANLRRCSPAARGIWVDVMCVLHDSDEYGVVRWPLIDLANSANAPIKLVRELVEKSVLKGGDKVVAMPFIYVPRSGRKNGDPVTLLPTQPGPLWYSSRMVKDEYVRTIRGEASRFGEGTDETPKASPKPPFGDGSTSSSSTTSSSLRSEDISSASAESKYPAEFEEAWQAYPDRPGRSKADACKAWKARVKAGADADVILAGVRRYAGFCAASQHRAAASSSSPRRSSGPTSTSDRTGHSPPCTARCSCAAQAFRGGRRDLRHGRTGSLQCLSPWPSTPSSSARPNPNPTRASSTTCSRCCTAATGICS